MLGGEENDTFNLSGGTINGAIEGSRISIVSGENGNDTFIIGNITINFAVIDGGAGRDQLRLIRGAVAQDIRFSTNALLRVDLYLQNIETITIDGGTVRGNFDASSTTTAVTLNLISGLIGGNVTGSNSNNTFNISGGTISGDVSGGNLNDIFNITGGIISGDVSGGDGNDTFNLTGGTIDGNVEGGDGNDTFDLYSALQINGYIDGGGGSSDVLRYAGASGNTYPANRGANGLAADAEISDGNGSVRNIESQTAVATITRASAGGLSVQGIEVLNLSPALNLYGAMFDALMQFGQRTAEGFGLADLDLSTGRATSLVAKDSPFSKGKIWAHKITHSGNGKGSIGLNLTGLTARADSDYDYEVSLTQHGFDAPLTNSKAGGLTIRAVSHVVNGVIETNTAEAKVSGYGAGVAMLWNGETLSAHITSLASAYEVEAHTSPLNPQAIVSEVSEGSFSAMNAVISVGLADRRELVYGLSLRTSADVVWQTLSLDDFSETGADGIIINFDKATRFTARIGAGLEAEHWFSDVAFVHETSSGGTLSSGLQQDYKQDGSTAIELRFGGKIADLGTSLTLKAYAGLRTSLVGGGDINPSARFDLSWQL